MTYTARTTLSLAAWDANEFEVEMVVKFTVAPARAQALNEPAEPATVEFVTIRLFDAGKKIELPCPDWLHERFADDEQFQDWLMAEADEQAACARDDAADAKRDERRLGL